ncbi:hypothetical protein A2310_08845 [candidate division WOR-1 bacterium RIFOXYB2_FULL_37_13]|uniref:Uncharacterized protein n=1 Tax=candidate division WOR-1 bacterium RIFOXYB2_FULL_37_13 TaxID=1802579 RepID=A0A1F4SH15_UNCSA|nr:MAG: hypothetical protein A2310_08845 [candidate division WOR-1 bacterium RIFOXYB2_FULL_37_13]
MANLITNINNINGRFCDRVNRAKARVCNVSAGLPKVRRGDVFRCKNVVEIGAKLLSMAPLDAYYVIRDTFIEARRVSPREAKEKNKLLGVLSWMIDGDELFGRGDPQKVAKIFLDGMAEEQTSNGFQGSCSDLLLMMFKSSEEINPTFNFSVIFKETDDDTCASLLANIAHSSSFSPYQGLCESAYFDFLGTLMERVLRTTSDKSLPAVEDKLHRVLSLVQGKLCVEFAPK